MMPLSKETECAEIYGIDILEESLQDLDAELIVLDSYQFCIHNFHGSIFDIIHTLNPF